MSETMTTLAAKSARKSSGFWVPRMRFSVDGVAVEEQVLRDVIELTYKDSVEQIDGFELVVGNWDATRRCFKYTGSEQGDARTALETLFEPCKKKVLLELGYGSELTQMMTASFTTMEPTFSAMGPHTLAVRALNTLHRLRRKKYDGNWHQQTDSQIAKSFDGKKDPDWKNGGQDSRRIPMDIETGGTNEQPVLFVGQKNEYDIDFLWRRARVRGYVVEVRRRSGTNEEYLYFGPSNVAEPVKYELSWGKSLVDLKVTLTTANQVKKVTVRGWDRAKQAVIEESVDWSDPKLKRLNPKLAEIVMQCDPREERVVMRPVFSKEQARDEARAILLGRAQDLVKVSGTTIGLPDLRAGSRLVLGGIGSRFSGEYFVTESTHTFNQDGYATKFSARREDPDTGDRL